ncbi:hypothetical protein E3G52_000361 [Mycobacteroides abscessus]|uniref:hypothetical protein n=1 Tax=Mycobacteroides abscessus TaxID=36809 RepID=UPI0018783F76|nr:hypothetical protein [Mycobacteroides abscessus]MBE5453497.1 hypothetical protein [Mycobacteroides abscessus]
MTRFAVATLVESIGLVLIIGGFWLINPAIGLIAAGIGCTAMGLAIDPPTDRLDRQREQ